MDCLKYANTKLVKNKINVLIIEAVKIRIESCIPVYRIIPAKVCKEINTSVFITRVRSTTSLI